jgi:hypothetical protein
MVHSMIFFKNVELMFWTDSILCAVYVKKGCPSHDIKNKNPYQMWYGHILSLRHLRVFGSTRYSLILKEQRSKIDARSLKCVFLGYSNTTKGNHIYEEIKRKFILSRDLIFPKSTRIYEIVEIDHLDNSLVQRNIMNLMMRFQRLKGL